ncbi:MAG TPA: XylR family transcriptional regulator [Tepidisphaeraceae bacterium]|jgi:LacI family transcriptional regulator|nr:XylR family transcriptional regulator [Tepidisphaeraceae bacterium]
MTPKTVGVVLYRGSGMHLRMLHGVQRFVQEGHDWRIQLIEPDSDQVPWLERAGVSGVLASHSVPELARLSRAGVPVVGMSHSTGLLLRLPGTICDDLAVGRVAAEALLAQPVADLGFVGRAGVVWSTLREAGFRSAVEQAGRRYHRCPEPHGAGQAEPSDDDLMEWLRSLPKPVGVLAANDVLGHRVAAMCQHLQIGVPDRVALVGVDNEELLCRMTHPPLSSVAIPHERIGYEAAALLHRAMSGQDVPTARVTLPPLGVVVRQSSEVLAAGDADLTTAVRFIRDRAGDPITVRDVLDQVPASRRSLERRFKKLYGRTLLQEIRRVRLTRVRDLLAHTDQSLKQVARRSGFRSVRRLHMVFTAEVGMTLAAYRRQFRSMGGDEEA